MTARTLMVQGTASGVGKSFLVAALCRLFARQGLRVLPFKAQNMSNNAAVTRSGGEIGRAQALQARAAGVDPDVRMNPVLLKPLSDTQSEVVVLGRGNPTLSAAPWMKRSDCLWPVVARALRELRTEADLVIIEGAGSPAEINLRASDIVNMVVAQEAGAPVLVVADIDRGGAFASLYGTWALLEERDRAHLRGFVLNRFRGDPTLLAPAPAWLEAKTGIPVLGIVPFLAHLLPEEDAATLGSRGHGGLTICAVRLPHLANFDDLDPLAAEPGVQVRWGDRPDFLDGAAAVVLPGSRNTLADLRWLWETGIAAAIRSRAAAGLPVVGLCGGYQMLGRVVADPYGVEAGGEALGLGLLEVDTKLQPTKKTRLTRARVIARGGLFARLEGSGLDGYEIHHGETAVGPGTEVWFEAEGRPLGAGRSRVWGTYLHDIFANAAVRSAWLHSLGVECPVEDWAARLDAELDRVADAVARSLDLDRVQALVGEGASCG